MLRLSGFELYSRWVPLENLTLFKEISILGTLGGREFFFYHDEGENFFSWLVTTAKFSPQTTGETLWHPGYILGILDFTGSKH